MLEKLTKSLPENIKTSVLIAAERLNPDLPDAGQDSNNDGLWAELNAKSAPQDSHDHAMAQRLEEIACIEQGAPFVARGLIRSGRFDDLQPSEKSNVEEKARAEKLNRLNSDIREKLRKASVENGAGCPGARGLAADDFRRFSKQRDN